MAEETPKIREDATAQNPKDVSSKDPIAPTATEAPPSNRSNDSAKEIALPDKGKDEEEKRAGKGTEQKDFFAMFIELIMTALGLNKEEKDHTKVAAEAQSSGSGAVNQSAVQEIAQNVSGKQNLPGNDISKLPEAVRLAATAERKNLDKYGATIQDTNTTSYPGAAKPPSPTAALSA